MKNNSLLTYSLKNEYVNITIIPQLGGKIIEYKTIEGYQPIFNKDEYIIPITSNFADYDTSGIDDCIPTIDSCYLKRFDVVLPDHGEVWYSSMNVDAVGNDYIELSMLLKTLPLKFKKRISIFNYDLKIDYEVQALDDNVPFLWAFHGLMNLDNCKRIHTHLKNIVQVDGYSLPNDINNLMEYEKNKYYKFYYDEIINEGKISLEYDEFYLHYTYDAAKLKYLGVWITTGGFKNECNIAIEPCNGYYDSLEKAINNDKYIYLNKNEIEKWTVKLSIEGKRFER